MGHWPDLKATCFLWGTVRVRGPERLNQVGAQELQRCPPFWEMGHLSCGCSLDNIRRNTAYTRNISPSISSSETCNELRELGSHHSSLCLGLIHPPEEAPHSLTIPLLFPWQSPIYSLPLVLPCRAFPRNGIPQTVVCFVWFCSMFQMDHYFVFIAGYQFTESEVYFSQASVDGIYLCCSYFAATVKDAA